MRLAIVISHPIQYYGPWFRHLAQQSDLSLKVFYLWDFGVTPHHDAFFDKVVTWDTDLVSGYEHEFVTNYAKKKGTHHFFGINNPSLISRLKSWKPDTILLFGYAYRTHLSLIFNAPAPLVFRGDSHLIGKPKPSFLKRFLLTKIYRQFAAVTYVGLANRDYFRTFNVPDQKLHFVPHCVDATHYTPTNKHLAAAKKQREQLNLTDKRVALFAGKFISLKQPVELVRAFIAVATERDALILAGDGPEKGALESLITQHPEVDIRFLPFANQSEMPARYLLGDFMVLPSHSETWGLAVNEAMHMGRPCLVSTNVGCQRDLVTEGETGWVFIQEETGSLQRALRRALDTKPEVFVKIQQNIAERIAGYTYAKATETLMHTLKQLPSPRS